MAKVRVKMNSAGARQLMNSPEMQSILKSYADKAAAVANASLDAQADEGYESYVKPGRNRARAVAHTTGIASQRHNRKHNALLKGL